MKASRPKAKLTGRISKKRQRRRVEQLARKSILPIVILTVILTVLVFWGYQAQVFEHMDHQHGVPAPIQSAVPR